MNPVGTEAIRLNRLVIAVLLLTAPRLYAENWPCWRGPRLHVTSLERRIPQSCTASRDLAWKTELPVFGHASPVVWNDRIFTVTAIPQEEARVLLCLDRKNGAVLWQKTVLKTP